MSKTILELVSQKDRPLKYLLEKTGFKTYYELKAELRKMLSKHQIRVYRSQSSKLIYVKRTGEKPNEHPTNSETVFIG